MQIKVDDEILYELNDIKQRVIKNDIKSELFDEDVKRRAAYYISHKYDQCYKKLEKEWMPKLAERGIENVPLNKDLFAELIFSQPDYKDRSKRDADEREAKIEKIISIFDEKIIGFSDKSREEKIAIAEKHI